MSNTLIWEKLCNTPPEHLKDFRRQGGFSGKSVDPTYRIKRLTEMFGPVGKGWRFVTEEHWREGDVVYVRGHIWYVLDGEKYETCSHTGGTVADRTPDESYKMSETDALGKCCLDLGLAADVYLGQHDGDKYTRPESGNQKPAQPKSAAQPQGHNEDDKPWYNDFEQDKEEIQHRINSGSTTADVIRDLASRYKVNRKVRAEISAMQITLTDDVPF